MPDEPVASFYHAETTDLERCQEIVEAVKAVISGVEVGCFLSDNGQQVVFHCSHPSTLTRSSALVLIKQFLRSQPDEPGDLSYGGLRVIAFANEKGGVAKTASCVNLATCLAMRGRHVLLLDLDSQANATLGLGSPVASASSAPERLLADPAFPLQKAIKATDVPGLDLVPSGPSLQKANHTLAGAVGRELKLRSKILRYARMPAANGYDCIMIDSPPAADLLTLNALMAATHLIVPAQASYYSLSAIGRLSSTVDSLYDSLDPRVQLLGILVTMYDHALPVQRAVLELLREKMDRDLGSFVFSTTIQHSPVMNESEACQRPVVITHPQSAAAQAYHGVAEEMLRRLGGDGDDADAASGSLESPPSPSH